MKKIIKNIAALSLAAVMAVSFTGCQKSGDTSDAGASSKVEEESLDTTTKELRQNDYRGGVMRTYSLQESVLKVMEDMKANNTVIRQDSPNSFWTADGYQDFVSTFLDIAIISDTQWFNEEETDWEAVLNQLVAIENSFCDITSEGGKLKSGVSVTRNEKDDYSVTGVPCDFNITFNGDYYAFKNLKSNYRILYDCDKDWCKAYATMTIDKKMPAITTELFEYQRVDNNTFAIQTSRERLVVVLAPAENDIDIRNREVKEFYYSKLVSEGQRTTYEPYKLLPETETLERDVYNQNVTLNELYTKDYPFLNQDGNLCSRYGEDDSMFFYSPKDITSKWVFEDKALQQGIAYKDGVLVVTTYNKLSNNYERFIYAKADTSDSTIKGLENLVEIKNLIGVQEAETATAPDEVPEPTGSTEETQETAEVPFGESEPETPDTTEAEPSESTSDSGAESEISG